MLAEGHKQVDVADRVVSKNSIARYGVAVRPGHG
jgi:hypothetical protein